MAVTIFMSTTVLFLKRDVALLEVATYLELNDSNFLVDYWPRCQGA